MATKLRDAGRNADALCTDMSAVATARRAMMIFMAPGGMSG